LSLIAENQDFGFGFAETIPMVIESLSRSDFQIIVTLVSNTTRENYEFAAALGMLCARRLRESSDNVRVLERILELARKSSVVAYNLGSIIHEGFTELEDKLRQVLLSESKQNINLAKGLKVVKCEYCDNHLMDNFDYFVQHMWQEHYCILRRNVPSVSDVDVECSCGKTFKNDINILLRHEGQEHYDSMPVERQKLYDRWKAHGFPKFKEDEI
jgi:hypothetical protein